MSLTTQFYTMLAMVGMGSWIGVALDTYGRFLKRPLRARWVIFINDFMFWVVQGLILFYLLLLVNEGELRIYIFLALLCGYAAYQGLFKQVYLKLLEYLIQTSIRLYNIIIKIGQVMLVRPIRALIQFFIVIVLGILNVIWKLLKWAFQFLYTLVKILLAPLRWTGRLLWKLVPLQIRQFFTRILYKLAGYLKKIKNTLNKLKLWWQRLTKK
ncbi:spore cortex biosynthesis protein YabQ [Metabacillus schmidteae]|uniref:spore cortex biosynthesis protein YabQ n=1 Tax=Metabacillus schmidteae TaxID=2730405 RepID=UPI00158C7F52|nr:spore cortex biosynthesis protein YabQ [Metabacillus schmidteae]